MLRPTIRTALFLLAMSGAASASPLGDAFAAKPAEVRAAVQQAAKADGLYAGVIDGTWGPGTERAVGDMWDILQMGGVVTPTIGTLDGASAFIDAVSSGEYVGDIERIRREMPAGEGMD